eukprot:1193886-Prorocentrum_minimum.AAC.1
MTLGAAKALILETGPRLPKSVEVRSPWFGGQGSLVQRAGFPGVPGTAATICSVSPPEASPGVRKEAGPNAPLPLLPERRRRGAERAGEQQIPLRDHHLIQTRTPRFRPAHPDSHTRTRTPRSAHPDAHTWTRTPRRALPDAHTRTRTPRSAHPDAHTQTRTPGRAHPHPHTRTCTPGPGF